MPQAAISGFRAGDASSRGMGRSLSPTASRTHDPGGHQPRSMGDDAGRENGGEQSRRVVLRCGLEGALGEIGHDGEADREGHDGVSFLKRRT